MIQYQANKSFKVDDRPIHVFDNLISKAVLNETYMALKMAPFTLTEIARPDVEKYRHWAHNMPLEIAQKFPLVLIANNVIKSQFKERYRAYRSYCNVATYGDMLYPHTDCLPDTNEMTALWFVQNEWNYEWGGET